MDLPPKLDAVTGRPVGMTERRGADLDAGLDAGMGPQHVAGAEQADIEAERHVLEMDREDRRPHDRFENVTDLGLGFEMADP